MGKEPLLDRRPDVKPRDILLGLTKPENVGFPLRWGIVGGGEISRQFVLASRQCSGATMAGVATRSLATAEAFAVAHDIEKAHDSIESMVASADIDIVYIGTPDELHKDHCMLAIRAGKHVLCEKMLALSVGDAEEMYAAAQKHNVMLQDGVWTRFFPAVEQARQIIESGAIGEVVMVQSDFDPLYTAQAATLAYGKDVKLVDMRVSGMLGGPGGAILEFENNRYANLTFIAYPSEFPEVTEITGTKGRITLEQPAHCPTALTVRIPSATPSRYQGGNTPSPLQRFEYPLPAVVSMPNAFPNQQGFYYMTEAVHRCLAAGLLECPQFGKAESLHLLEIVCAINAKRRENAEIGRPL